MSLTHHHKKTLATGWAVGALLVLNLMLKLAWTGTNELAGDEPFTVYWALQPIKDLMAMLAMENNPPLYFLLMHAWAAIVPLDPAWLRIPSALFSALTVWPLFLIGKRLAGPGAGWAAALLFTFSQHHYGFAHEVRAYSLLVLACTWAVWQLIRLADDKHRHPALRPATLAWLVAANVLATWAHYFGWLMVGLELIMVFSVALLRTVRVRMLGATLLTVLFSLPLLGILRNRAATSLGHGTWLAAPAWEEPYNMLMRWSNAPVVAVCFLIVIVWALARSSEGRRQMAIPLIWALVPLVGMFAISFLFPIYLDRYLLFASPAFYLLVGVALQRSTTQPTVRLIMTALAVGAMGYTFRPWQDTGSHPSRVAAQVAHWREGNTVVLIQPAWYALNYAWASNPQLYTGLLPLHMALEESAILAIPADRLPPLDSTVNTVIHIDAWATLTDPQGAVLDELRERFLEVDSVEADKKVITRLFRRP